MQIYYDPSDGQVMAYYTGVTNSIVWGELGYLMYNTEAIAIVNGISRWGRDCQLVFNEQGEGVTVIPAVNPIQPTP